VVIQQNLININRKKREREREREREIWNLERIAGVKWERRRREKRGNKGKRKGVGGNK
jgi:hypothetical protein